jgi:prepilin-type N-terminal cleavage/methylation domain-containing protein
MKVALFTKRDRAMTLVEVLAVMAVVLLLGLFLLPSIMPNRNIRNRALRIQCVNNLKQVGLAYRVWEGDHGNNYPMCVSETNGGTMEFTTGLNAWRHFQIMSNELSTPRVLLCPVDDLRTMAATNFAFTSNSNISYFVGVDANELNPQLILSGDHNLTNGTPVRNGLLELTTNNPAGWTAKMHEKVGNVGLADGSVQQVSITGLRYAVANAGIATNRLQMPILGP